jgi:endonuclease/exonuclease/phosphatase family metal-dependent hydrolase
MSTGSTAPAGRGRARVAALALAALLAFALPAAAQGRGTGSELRVMSFNLRFASATPPNSWPERRPVMRELLRHERPELLGTQEGLYQQLQDIEADLPDHYDSIGEGRDGGSAGEAMQIFYDTRRLEPLELDHYWLSDTPDVVGSKTWGGCCPRMVTWIRFLDRVSGEQFYAVNTHFEAFDAVAREKSAQLLLQRAEQDFDPALPVIVTGDFNEPARAGRTVYDLLVTDGPFVDTWETATERSALVGTFHGYRPLTPDGDRIDWILTTPDVTASRAEIITFEKHGQYPSDHLPVQADVELPVD